MCGNMICFSWLISKKQIQNTGGLQQEARQNFPLPHQPLSVKVFSPQPTFPFCFYLGLLSGASPRGPRCSRQAFFALSKRRNLFVWFWQKGNKIPGFVFVIYGWRKRQIAWFQEPAQITVIQTRQIGSLIEYLWKLYTSGFEFCFFVRWTCCFSCPHNTLKKPLRS